MPLSQSLMEVFHQTVRELQARPAEESNQPEPVNPLPSTQPEASSVQLSADALAEICKQVHNNQISILSDGEGGLYPYPRTRWISHHWSSITSCWLKSFPDVFKAVENEDIIPELSFHAEPIDDEPELRRYKPPLVTRQMLRAWKTARPWLLARLPELERYGWTRSKLFRAGQLKYPVGPWGVAFSRNWLRPDVQVCIVPEDGAIRWTWTEPSGRTVSQAARPRVQSIQEKI